MSELQNFQDDVYGAVRPYGFIKRGLKFELTIPSACIDRFTIEFIGSRKRQGFILHPAFVFELSKDEVSHPENAVSVEPLRLWASNLAGIFQIHHFQFLSFFEDPLTSKVEWLELFDTTLEKTITSLRSDFVSRTVFWDEVSQLLPHRTDFFHALKRCEDGINEGDD